MASKVSHLLISHKVNRLPLTGGRARASLPPYIVHPLSRHPPPTFNVVLAVMPLITLRIMWGKSAFENIFEAKTSQSQNDNFPATKVVYVTVKRTARKGVPAHGPCHAHEPIDGMEGRNEGRRRSFLSCRNLASIVLPVLSSSERGSGAGGLLNAYLIFKAA